MKRKSIYIILAMLFLLSSLVACAPKETDEAMVEEVASEEEAVAEEAVAEEAEDVEEAAETDTENLRIVLIGNQRFGDLGPMDDLAKGLDQCAEDFGVEIKKLESESPERFEEDIRAMAKEGYDLIYTTYPAMTDPTITVAQEFPETKFMAIYQFVNAGDEKLANVVSTEFRGHETNYVLGAMAAKLTTSKKIGYISGTEEPSINGDMNGFMQAVAENCADCSVEFAFAGSWEDPAKGKEIAKAMIGRGVDIIQTEAAKTQLGAIEAAKEAGIFIFGDNGDNYDLYQEGFITWVNASFFQNVYYGCETLVDGSLPVGTHAFMTLENGGVYVPWEAVDRFIADNPDYADVVGEAKAFGEEVQQKIIDGEIEVIYNPDTPTGVNP